MPGRGTTVPGHSARRGGHCNWSKGGNRDEPIADPSKRPREAPILIAPDVAEPNSCDIASAPGVEIVYVERVVWQADVQLPCYVEYVAVAPVDEEVSVARYSARYPRSGIPIRKIQLSGHVPADFRKHRAIKMFAAESARAHQRVATRRRLGTSPDIRCRHAISRLMAHRRLGQLPGTGRANQRQRGCGNSAPHSPRYTNDFRWWARSVEKAFTTPNSAAPWRSR